MNENSEVVYLCGNNSISWKEGFGGRLYLKFQKLGFTNLSFQTPPDSILMRKKYLLKYLNSLKLGIDTILIGYSSGALASMKYLETNRVKMCILISPQVWINDEYFLEEKQSGFFDEEWDFKSIKQNCDLICVVYSNNDRYIVEKQFLYLIDKLNCEKLFFKDQGHFTERDSFDEIVEFVREVFLK